MKPSPNEVFHAAQILVRDHDQPVFPCRSEGEKAKAPLTRNGLHDATLNRAQIKNWWQQYPNAAIGIPTGIVWDVLDVDTKGEHDGRLHLTRLNELGLLDGCKFVVKTPSGGWHLYFTARPGLTNKAVPDLGLDVRSKGGYVLAPPSYINDGDSSVGCYEQMGQTQGSNDEPLMWDLIMSCLRPVNRDTKKPVELLPSERRHSLGALREWLSHRVTGERNNSLHWAVCRCIEAGIDPHELVEVATVELGLGEDEVLLTINSALRRAGVRADDLSTEAESLFPER